MTFLRVNQSWGTRLVAAILLFGLVAGIACGQTAADNSKTIIEDYFRTARASDWKSCAATVYPGDLAKFKGVMVPLLTGIKDAGNPADPLLPFFEGATGWEMIFAKDSSAFFVGTMNWITSLAPQIGTMMAGTDVQFVGFVDEGKETRHYVIHMKAQPESTESSTDVVSVRKTGDRWMMLMGGTINQLAGLFRRPN